MLVLSRQKDQTIIIGDDVEITVIAIRGDKVSLGIDAPRSVAVHRKEVYDAIKREDSRATQGVKNIKDVDVLLKYEERGNGSGGGRGNSYVVEIRTHKNYDIIGKLARGERVTRQSYCFC